MRWALGQTVVVENRAGAGGLVDTEYVSKQVADGYTLWVSHASVHVYAAATGRVDANSKCNIQAEQFE